MAITKIPRSGIADSAVTTAKVSDGVINAATEFTDSTIASTRLADCAVTNAKLSNSAITIRGSSTSLGGSLTLNPFVNWQSKVTGDGSTVTTAVAGQGFFVDTSSATATIRLPSSANRGDTISIKDYAGTFGTNGCTIDRNSHNIQGTGSNSIISTNRAAVTLVYADSTKGWLFSDEHNVGDLAPPHIQATGGTVTTSGDFKIHSFTGDGNFVVSNAGNSSGSNSVNYLVVAAGGGGATNGGGGAGAGGYRTNFPSPATGGLSVTAQTYPITIGAGGTDGPNCDGVGTNGSASSFSTISSAGGGGGGSPTSPSPERNGQAGGSGGGGGSQYSGGAGNTPPVSPSQGNNGGDGSTGPNCGSTSGGGGGAGAVGDTGQTPGSAPFTNMGACGGAGSPNSITGSAVVYSGGGGGQRAYTPGAGIPVGSGGAGGNGGGGVGGSTGAPPNPNIYTQAANGTANTGGGGGGGTGNHTGGHGGSGIVIIRYEYQQSINIKRERYGTNKSNYFRYNG